MKVEPESFLPLTPVAYELLLSLAGEARHGYAILRDMGTRPGSGPVPNAGTLYRAIARLVDAGLIREMEEAPDPADDDARRRYYGLTPLGRAVLSAEAARLEAAVAAARARNVLPRPGPA